MDSNTKGNLSPEIDAEALFVMAAKGEKWISITAPHFWQKEWLGVIKRLVSLAPHDSSRLLRESIKHIPKEWGQLIREHVGGGERLFILLQDNYFNWRARLNQSHILKALTYTGCVKLVCSSGASGEVDTSPVSSFHTREVRLRTALMFLKSLELTAEEFCQIVDNTDFVIWGIEDAQLYKKQLGLVADERKTEMLKMHKDVPSLYLSNALKKMEEMNVPAAVLTTCAQDLVSVSSNLKEMNISHFWIRGKAEGDDNLEEYSKLIIGKRRPVNDLIAESNGSAEQLEF